MGRRILVQFDTTLQGWPSLGYLQELAGDEYELVLGSQPDFVFFGPYQPARLWPRLGSWSPPVPPPRGRYVRIFWTGENRPPDFVRFDWCFTFHYDDEIRDKRHYRRPVWHPHVGLAPSQPVAPKTKFCNFLFSNEVAFREEFFEILSRYKRVDAPGISKNNMPPIGGHASAHASRYDDDWETAKREFLRPYKFTIAFENESVPGYTTEKLYDPMLVDSIPIYWGNPLVSRDYNTRSFVNWHDYGSHEATVARVIELDNDDELYASVLREPRYLDESRAVLEHMAGLRQQLRRIFDLGLSVREHAPSSTW